MENLQTCKFFSLQNFPYKTLLEFTYPWQVVHNLPHFFSQLSLGSLQGNISKKAYLENAPLISIGEGTIIEPGAYIKGPCCIGKNCVIRHGAYLREHTFLGDECVIGHATEIKHSVFLNKACAPHFAYIGDSIIGNAVNLGAGVRCSNFRLDRKEISFFYQGEIIATHLKKLGAIIGDGSQIGCNVVLNPGTLIGQNSLCYPNMTLSGYVSYKSIIRPAKSFI